MKQLLRSSHLVAARYLRTAIIIPALCWAVVPAFPQGVNFDDGTDQGAVRMDPIQDALGGPTYAPAFATWSFTNGGYRIQADVSPDAGNFGPARAGSYWTNDIYTYTNFYVSADVRPWGTVTNQAVGILGRIRNDSGGGYVYAYTLTYEPYVGDFQISAYNGGYYQQLTVTNLSLSPTNMHRLVFTGTGDSLEGRIYEYPDLVNPVAMVSTTDSTYTIGWCGLLVFSNPNDACDATYNNYLALPAPPISLSIMQSGAEVAVSWPVGLVNYTLQSNALLPASSWTSITNGITQSGGRYIYTTTPAGTAFYRLVAN